MVDFTAIEQAATRLAGVARKTPLLSSEALNAIAGRPVYIKAECDQHTGSFKLRGAWNAVHALAQDKDCPGVIAYSSGNHAQGVAFAAQRHDLPAVIIMPSDAPALKTRNTRALGAEVVLYDRAREDRDAIGAKIAQERGLRLIKPFDDPLVIAGQGTVGIEIADDMSRLGLTSVDVFVPCGGGGLTSGIAVALKTRLPEATISPVEPDGFDDVRRSLIAGTPVANAQKSGSICDAILTQSPGEITFPILKQHCNAGISVTDEDCLHAIALAHHHLGLKIEPGGAVALAAALFHPHMSAHDVVIAVASGGNIDPSLFETTLTSYGSP
ncbi:MAG: threonine ammonia-lyase [Halocynthiibacter sp.]